MQYLLIYRVSGDERLIFYKSDSLENMDIEVNNLLAEYGEKLTIEGALKVAETYDYTRVERFTR